MKRCFWPAAVLAGLALAQVASAQVAKGKPAPNFSAKSTAGKPVSLAQLKGKAVLINFFSYS
jgi:cytochrome oxidase Cu insertion factor (SCO1/SenC/PrrC family)